MITAGVDLATEPAATALCVIDWTPGAAVVRSLALGVDDATIADATTPAAKLGIDCPLGWPDDFLAFIQAHHHGHVVAPEDVVGIDWRRRLAYRETDRAVTQRIGMMPLSVATDRIGLTAMRAAGLLADLAERGQPVDRAGEGVVVEVYPAASLKSWGLRHNGYKGKDKRAVRETLLRELLASAPQLDLRAHADLCVSSDDAFDAVIAALTSRAAALEQVTQPAGGTERARAGREGWIALPTGPLSALFLT